MKFQAIIAEDANRQYESLASELTADGWEVTRALDRDDVFRRMEILRNEKKPLDAIAIDLGLPPEPDHLQVGLRLAEEVRKSKGNQDLPILAYTSQAHTDYVLYASAVRRLLAIRASFIYLRPLNSSFAQLMNYVRQGFVIYSPAPASYLPNAVPDKPDPLDKNAWDTLYILSKGATHEQAAEALDVSVETIRNWLRIAYGNLQQRGELPEKYRQETLIDWYREHVVRYAYDTRTVDIPGKSKKKSS